MSVLSRFRKFSSAAYLSQAESITDNCFNLVGYLHARYVHTLGDPLMSMCLDLEKSCMVANRYRTDDLDQIIERRKYYKYANGMLDEICTHLSRIERLTQAPSGNTLWVNKSNETLGRNKATELVDNIMQSIAESTDKLYKSLNSLNTILDQKQHEIEHK